MSLLRGGTFPEMMEVTFHIRGRHILEGAALRPVQRPRCLRVTITVLWFGGLSSADRPRAGKWGGDLLERTGWTQCRLRQHVCVLTSPTG